MFALIKDRTMKNKPPRSAFIVFALALLLGACGPTAPPTPQLISPTALPTFPVEPGITTKPAEVMEAQPSPTPEATQNHLHGYLQTGVDLLPNSQWCPAWWATKCRRICWRHRGIERTRLVPGQIGQPCWLGAASICSVGRWKMQGAREKPGRYSWFARHANLWRHIQRLTELVPGIHPGSTPGAIARFIRQLHLERRWIFWTGFAERASTWEPVQFRTGRFILETKRRRSEQLCRHSIRERNTIFRSSGVWKLQYRSHNQWWLLWRTNHTKWAQQLQRLYQWPDFCSLGWQRGSPGKAKWSRRTLSLQHRDLCACFRANPLVTESTRVQFDFIAVTEN